LETGKYDLMSFQAWQDHHNFEVLKRNNTEIQLTGFITGQQQKPVLTPEPPDFGPWTFNHEF